MIEHRVWDFPDLPVSGQLFHVPGAAIDGGFTAGGMQVLSPEPGGRSVLELRLSMQRNEWVTPWASWLMSKINGDIFKIRLVFTPQLISTQTGKQITQLPTYHNPVFASDDTRRELVGQFGTVALEGTNVVQIDMTSFGQILRHGHLVGHEDNCYIVDDITYAGMIATITLNPPLRKNVAIGDDAPFRPYFIGTIANGGEIRAAYDAANNGLIQLERIIFNEAIL
jgi:hypothetical protein